MTGADKTKIDGYPPSLWRVFSTPTASLTAGYGSNNDISLIPSSDTAHAGEIWVKAGGSWFDSGLRLYAPATTSAAGSMSAADKTKLNNVRVMSLSFTSANLTAVGDGNYYLQLNHMFGDPVPIVQWFSNTGVINSLQGLTAGSIFAVVVDSNTVRLFFGSAVTISGTWKVVIHSIM